MSSLRAKLVLGAIAVAVTLASTAIHSHAETLSVPPVSPPTTPQPPVTNAQVVSVRLQLVRVEKDALGSLPVYMLVAPFPGWVPGDSGADNAVVKVKKTDLDISYIERDADGKRMKVIETIPFDRQSMVITYAAGKTELKDGHGHSYVLEP